MLKASVFFSQTPCIANSLGHLAQISKEFLELFWVHRSGCETSTHAGSMKIRLRHDKPFPLSILPLMLCFNQKQNLAAQVESKGTLCRWQFWALRRRMYHGLCLPFSTEVPSFLLGKLITRSQCTQASVHKLFLLCNLPESLSGFPHCPNGI